MIAEGGPSKNKKSWITLSLREYEGIENCFLHLTIFTCITLIFTEKRRKSYHSFKKHYTDGPPICFFAIATLTENFRI
jgi:hypothetical protein